MSNMQVTLSLSATIRYNCSSPPPSCLWLGSETAAPPLSLSLLCAAILNFHMQNVKPSCYCYCYCYYSSPPQELLLLFPHFKFSHVHPASLLSATNLLLTKGENSTIFHSLRLTHCVSFGVYQLASGVLLSCAWYPRVSREYSKWQGVNIISGSLTCMYHVWMTFPMMY